jgi:hypothetical protein
MFKNAMKIIKHVVQQACFKTKNHVLQQVAGFPSRVGKINMFDRFSA